MGFRICAFRIWKGKKGEAGGIYPPGWIKKSLPVRFGVLTNLGQEDYPLFRKLYDLAVWLTRGVEQYPKSQRFLLGSKTLDLSYEFLSLLVQAIYADKAGRKDYLKEMSVIVERERVLLRLAMDLKYLSFK